MDQASTAALSIKPESAKSHLLRSIRSTAVFKVVRSNVTYKVCFLVCRSI